MGTETASVLFTDVVGSTELRVRLGEERADVMRRVHDDLVGNAVSGTGGRVVKGLGDGAMAVFGSAADAVAAAVGIQQAVERNGRGDPDAAFDLRIGISVGDVLFEDGDCHGAAVVEAARLCAAAQAGQVLVADLVRALARGRGGFVFESVGELELKGLDAPLSACFVAWEPVAPPETGAGPPPFPRLLAPPTPTSYAGRADLLAGLDAVWDRVAGGEGSRVVLLSGEPGIGKTRTAAEVARRAHEAGATVLYGRCDETLGLPYEPFVEALDWQTAHTPALPLGRFAGDLRRLVPDLDARIAGLPTAIRSDPRTEEHRLFEATASWLASASGGSGLVLVVDDLHWATVPTLQLLLHAGRVAAADPEARLLVLGTYRDTDVSRGHALFDLLGELRRLPAVDRMSVGPLTEAEVLDLLAEVAGHELDDGARRLARRTYAETEGNPFFVGEVMRHFIETGVVSFEGGRWMVADPDVVDVPEGVRDVIGRRLNRLSPEAGKALSVAAVLGRVFDLELLTAVTRTGSDALVDALDEALRARLVEEADAGRFRFVHVLTRQTLYDELTAIRRRRLHRQVVDCLEVVRPTDVTALAHHAVEAGIDRGDPGRATRYMVAAGEEALAARAVAEAHGWFLQALELLDDADEADPVVRLQARCGLGEAQRDRGDPAYRETLLRVSADALAADRVDLAVRAAIANSRGIPSIIGAVDAERVDQLEDVLAVLGEDDTSPQRALLLATLSAELLFRPDAVERRLALADRAVELAEESDDPWVLARVLVGTGFAVNVPERLDALEAHTRRGVEMADRAGDPSLQAIARQGLAWARLVAGRIRQARTVAEEARALADDGGTPTVRWIMRAWNVQHLAREGRLDAAREESDRVLELGQQAGEPDAPVWWAAHQAFLAVWEGTAVALADLVGEFADQYPNAVVWRIGHAYTMAEGGSLEQARRLVRPWADPRDVPRDFFTLQAWTSLALMARLLDDAELARRVVGVLEPHAGRWAATGTWLSFPVDGALAVARCTAGDLDGAAASGAAAWEALTAENVRDQLPLGALRLVEVLTVRGRDEDLALARAMAERGRAEAVSMGMDQMAGRLDELVVGLPTG